MHMSYLDGACFGLWPTEVGMWMLAANLVAMNVSLGRHHPGWLWLSVPNAFAYEMPNAP